MNACTHNMRIQCVLHRAQLVRRRHNPVACSIGDLRQIIFKLVSVCVWDETGGTWTGIYSHKTHFRTAGRVCCAIFYKSLGIIRMHAAACSARSIVRCRSDALRSSEFARKCEQASWRPWRMWRPWLPIPLGSQSHPAFSVRDAGRDDRSRQMSTAVVGMLV